MSRFFVGQRVRIISTGPLSRPLLGSETRIVDDWNGKWYLDLRHPTGEIATIRKIMAAEFLSPVLPPNSGACDDDFKRDLDKLLSKEESRVS